MVVIFPTPFHAFFNLVVNGEVLFSLIGTLHYWYNKAMVQKGHQNRSSTMFLNQHFIFILSQ
jgi:heme/copper-type cytochrome/quinol oxidase subunit 1